MVAGTAVELIPKRHSGGDADSPAHLLSVTPARREECLVACPSVNQQVTAPSPENCDYSA